MDPLTMALLGTGIQAGGSFLSGLFGGDAIDDAQAAQLQALQQAQGYLGQGRDARIAGLDQMDGYYQGSAGHINRGANRYDRHMVRGQNALLDAYNSANDYLDPYYQTGVDANSQTRAALGLDGADAQQAFYDNFRDDPGFAESLAAGQQAIERSAAARGGLMGGGTAKDLYSHGQQARLGAYQDRLNRLDGLSNRGYGAASQMGQLNAAKGNALLNIAQSRGDNRRWQAGQNASIAQQRGGIRAGMGDVHGGYYDNMGNLALQRGNINAGAAMAQGQNTQNMIGGITNAFASGMGSYGSFNPFGF